MIAGTKSTLFSTRDRVGISRSSGTSRADGPQFNIAISTSSQESSDPIKSADDLISGAAGKQLSKLDQANVLVSGLKEVATEISSLVTDISNYHGVTRTAREADLAKLVTTYNKFSNVLNQAGTDGSPSLAKVAGQDGSNLISQISVDVSSDAQQEQSLDDVTLKLQQISSLSGQISGKSIGTTQQNDRDTAEKSVTASVSSEISHKKPADDTDADRQERVDAVKDVLQAPPDLKVEESLFTNLVSAKTDEADQLQKDAQAKDAQAKEAQAKEAAANAAGQAYLKAQSSSSTLSSVDQEA